jgi:CRISPR-associated protein (TIGR02710 family)
MTKESAILVCTVGGSHQPILTALNSRPWDRVVFVCSAPTPESRGSAGMVTEAVEIPGAEARPAHRIDPIPVQAGLEEGRWEIVEVPPDEPDRAFRDLVDRLRPLAGGGARLVADYTGGTKSMSAALFLAALEVDAQLQLVSGRRSDLVRVVDLTERDIAIGTRRVAAAREFGRLAAGWGRFAYQEVAEGFARVRDDLKAAGLPRDELGRFNRAQELSDAFAAWDRFDHKKAAGCLKKSLYKDLEIGGRTDWFELASALARGQDSPWGALHLADLWRSAQRCAERGRYDDAVARLYRLWEAIAQWLLRHDCAIDTAVIKTGLRQSWDLYLHLRPDGAAASFWRRVGEDRRSELDRLSERLSIRNNSILAHGWNAVTPAGWNSLSEWTGSGLREVLAREAGRLAEAHELPQLPTALPAL